MRKRWRLTETGNNYSAIKKLIHIVLGTTAALAGLVGLIYLLLWLPPVQQKIKDFALKAVMEKTHNRMSIGKLTFRPFNHLQLENVYVEDLQHDTLLYVSELSASVDSWKLLNNHLLIKSVDLDDFVINVDKNTPDSTYNFQFLIDAFASDTPKDTTKTSMRIELRNIALGDGRINYKTDSLDVHLSDFQAKIDCPSIDLAKLDVTVKQLSFTESRGFELKNLQLQAKSKDNTLTVNNFLIELPHSICHSRAGGNPTIQIPLSLFSGDSRLRGNDTLYLPLTGQIDFQDIAMWLPAVKNLTEVLTFTGTVSSTFPEIALSALQADYGEHIHLLATGSIQDFQHLETSPVQLDLKELTIDATGMKQILGVADAGALHATPLPGTIDLTGTAQGTLSDLALNLLLKSDKGDAGLKGTGSYDLKTGHATFDANVGVDRFNMGFLMQNQQFGLADLNVQIKGSFAPKQGIHAEAKLDVQRFDFKGYAYNNIHADAVMRGDSVRLDVDSDDPNLQLDLHARADIGKKSPGIKINADIESAYLDTLLNKAVAGEIAGRSPQRNDISGMCVTTKLRANVVGLNPEKMQASVVLDNLNLETNKGNFYEPHFKLTYQAADSAHKQLTIVSNLINATVDGQFTYNGLAEVFKENFPVLFPHEKVHPKLKDQFAENMNFRVGVNHLNSLTNILDLSKAIPDSILFMGKYSNAGDNLKISASAYTLLTGTDTTQLSLSLSKVGDFPRVVVNVDNRSNKYNVDASVVANIELIPHFGQVVPDMNIALDHTVIVFNDTWFDLNPSKMEIRNGRYTIQDFSISVDEDPQEYIKINGVASVSRDDSVTIDISHFQLGTLLNAAKTPIPLSGMADGRITARQILNKPFVLSRGFAIKNLMYAGNELGDLSVTSGFNGERNGVFMRAALGKAGATPSVVSGMFLPEKDSMSVTANIQDVELKWFNEATGGTLYGLNGKVATKLKVAGTISKPDITGSIYFDNAQVGVTMLNTIYSINDSIQITPHAVSFNKLTIFDENQHTLVANGTITHDWFTNLNPLINLMMSDFQVLNNPKQTDSLFYGNLRLNGLLDIKKSNRDWLMTGTITHANDSKVTVNIPFSASTAERYNSITYVDSTWTPLAEIVDETKPKAPAKMIIPLKMQLAIFLDPSLTVGAVFNTATGDAAQVAGNGAINLSYDMTAPAASAMSVTGDYTVESGNVSMTVANLVRKSFAIQNGGKLAFHGAPMATTFDVTAIYKTRADLNSLDPSFSNIVANPKVPVNCELSVSGSIEKMTIAYDVTLPNESDDVNRKMAGLLYSDNLKIKEMAYLLAFNTFTPLQSSSITPNFGSGQVLSSLASLTTGQLSKALSNALGDNWSIGADVSSKDDFNNVDVDFNMSTAIFNDRLTINGTVGYSNDPSKRQNFTGDFDVEYKLTPAGNILLQVYNETNNQYYEQAATTQGVGIVYKRNARTFKSLFQLLKKKK
ncbi:MAG: translocation/assembly module TamB domain-containing protein [Candidatus Symbiothrix sp.]|nr:translocation/assembly module TamB domain-containing protein [Candidatus Symbiothrix sp.]